MAFALSFGLSVVEKSFQTKHGRESFKSFSHVRVACQLSFPNWHAEHLYPPSITYRVAPSFPSRLGSSMPIDFSPEDLPTVQNNAQCPADECRCMSFSYNIPQKDR